jgi:hypothetical protein
MLSNQHFYHRITRKLVVGFGTLFNNIRLVRYNKAGTTEIERVTVPLSYMPKEKFYQRITQDPNLNRKIQILLPRMSFELVSITYDPLRKRNLFSQEFSANSNTTIKSAHIAPYNYSFQLNIFVRNAEDGTQIVEQILPYFTPDYTLTIDLADIGNIVDVPIILESINYSVTGDVGTSEELRTLVWTLVFTVKAYLYGPITSNTKIIRKSTANTYDSTYIQTGERKINLTSGSGNYKIGELVFEGKKASAANASGFVKSWDNVANQVIVTDVSGVLLTGKKLTGAVSNTSYTINTFDINDNQLINLTVVPNPSNANVDEDFGFTETIEEYPYIT